MKTKVKVVVVTSLSFTGTTWINTVLGCHDRAFALGPADRMWNMANTGEGYDKACLIHGATCSFWPKFLENYKQNENFFSQLASASGRDVIITNNPLASVASKELSNPDINVSNINLIRDGRAILASYMRKFPSTSALDALTDFLYPSFRNFYFDQDNPDRLCLRYEDILAQKEEALKTIGEFVGLDYDPSALKFWTFDHHIAAGNQGLIGLIKFGQGLPVANFQSREFYEEQFNKTEATNDASFQDERWMEELTSRELFIFDLFCGPDNKRFGYERDRFTLPEISQYSGELLDAIEAKTIKDEYVELIKSRLNTVDIASPSVESAYIAMPEGAASSLKQQCNKQYLMTHGLRLMPRHLRRLAKYATYATLTIMSFMLLTVLIYVI